MAALTDRLPTEIDSQQRFIQPAPPAPSIFETLANFGSKVVGVADTAINSLKQDSEKKNIAKDTTAKNDAAKAYIGIFSEPDAAPQGVVNTPTDDPAHNAAVSQVKAAAPSIVNQQTAAAQGKIDPAAAQARALAIVRQTMAANPGREAVVVTAFRELGVTNMITQQYANAEKGLESNQEAQASAIHTLESSIVNKWGWTDYYKMSPDKQAEIRAQVGVLEAKEADLDSQTKLADLTLKKFQLTGEQYKQVQTQLSSATAQSALSYMNSSYTNLNKLLINTLSDPSLSPAEAERLQSKLLGTALPALDQVWATQMVPRMVNMTAEDRSFLTTQYQQMKTNLTGILSGPQSIVEQNNRIMQDLSNTYGIDYAKSAPTLLRLQKLVGSQALGVLLSPSITGNSALMNMIGQELKGAIANPSKQASFTEFVSSLAGQTDLSSWDPEKIRSMAPALISSTAALSRNTPASNGTDKEAHLALINSIKNTAGIAVDVVPQWGFKSVLTQSKVLNSAGVLRAMVGTSANAQERTDAIRAWVPATARSYEVLSSLNAGDKYYSVRLDPHTLTWSAVWNGRAETRPMPGVGIDLVMNSHPAPTTAVLEQASTLNHMLNNLSLTASKGMDDSFNGKSVPYAEARKFFAKGEIPASLQKPAAGKGGKTPEQNIEDAVSHMLDFVNKLPTASANTPAHKADNLPPAIENKAGMDAYYAGPGKKNAALYQQYAPAVATAAEAHGIPVGVAMNLIHTESKFNPNADSGQAHGLGQISYKEAARRGWDLKSMSPQENLDKAMRMLAENYKATGNWQDAAAMYLTGRSIAKAGNAKDKNGTTAPTYAAAVVPSSLSSWLPVGSAAGDNQYGYSRY